MKGVSTALVFLIIAVIFGVIVLWLMWSKGMLPFLGGADEATCRTAFIKACSYTDETERLAQLQKISSLCPNNWSSDKTLQTHMTTCISNSGTSADCDPVCQALS